MKDLNIEDKRIIRIADLLEQIKSTDQIIKIHKEDPKSIMLDQYEYRRSLFLKEVGSLLVQLNISPSDLIAA